VRRARGFTLVEVLIAMAITAFIAAAAYAGLSNVLLGAEQLQAAGGRTRDINRAMTLLERDMRQFVNRPVRDEFGGRQPGLTGGPLALFPLSLTRSGWHNSLELPRSDLQRVHYYIEDDALWRAYYTVLDQAVDTQLQRVRLLDGIEDFQLRFLATLEALEIDRDLVVDTRSWLPNWVPEPGTSASNFAPPVAIELRLELVDLGPLRRVYALPQT
jgi:general secretion pathway protein J